ncbi:MAG: hypothetical protein K6G36_00560 [Candidatus Saccharibacteria bacterium]|nr:hypothetical protein [Candidatus Saccharibacteria bacterium]
MAKEVAISKRLKITKAQQNMLFAVLIASIVLGAALSISINLIKRISFNKDVIVEKDKAISEYSRVISGVGVCKKPKGPIYTEEELKKCNPDSITLSEIPGTLRANILQDLAANPALTSVLKEDEDSCINSSTGKNYTYDELRELYLASSEENRASASDLLKACSALRVIPDALPSFRNEEALLSSLNMIFDISGWTPESLMPGDSGAQKNEDGLLSIGMNLTVESGGDVTMEVLDNIERSIRTFDLNNVNVEWAENGYLNLSARASAYYVEPSTIIETRKTIRAGGNK